jgi:hypothetical protein
MADSEIKSQSNVIKQGVDLNVESKSVVLYRK